MSCTQSDFNIKAGMSCTQSDFIQPKKFGYAYQIVELLMLQEASWVCPSKELLSLDKTLPLNLALLLALLEVLDHPITVFCDRFFFLFVCLKICLVILHVVLLVQFGIFLLCEILFEVGLIAFRSSIK